MASTTNGVTTFNATHDPSQSIPQDLDVHIRRSSHSGLSALLNAVTLHIAKSDENKDESNSLQRGVHDTESDDCHRDAPPYTATPTMVPEGHGAHNHTFPGILMTLLLDPDNADILTFLPDGKYFALRKDEFAAKVMKKSFTFESYESFLDELSRHGFSAVETKRPGIEVYRHRLFRKGDWERCGKLVTGEAESTIASLNELPPPVSGSNSRTSSISEDELHLDRSVSSESAKRRLSPTSAAKANPGNSSKLRINCSDDESSSSVTIAGDPAQKAADRRRSVALSLTSEKLNIRESDDRVEFPLVQQAVSGATHTIVTDAIEALLRDEEHTRKTFEKHEDELSKSSLPGLVPISKQLFSNRENGSRPSSAPTTITATSASVSAEPPAAEATTKACETDSSVQQNNVDEKNGDAGKSEKLASKK